MRNDSLMSTLTEIEAAVEQLPLPEKEELQVFLDSRVEAERKSTAWDEYFQNWLKTARGAGIPGITTDDVMRLTRGEE